MKAQTILLLLFLFNSVCFGKTKIYLEISKDEFEEIIKKDLVKRILIVNERTVHITLNSKGLAQSKYKEYSPLPENAVNIDCHLQMTFYEIEKFYELLDNIQKDNEIPENERIHIENTSSYPFFYIFIILLISFILTIILLIHIIRIFIKNNMKK